MSKTALELTPQEWLAYRPDRAIDRYRGKEELQLKHRRERAWQLAREIAHLLRTEFGASKVVAFGSLAHNSWFTSWSDIDLAAWDIPADRFFCAVAAVTGISSEFKVDLVDPDLCRATLRVIIEQDGIEL